MRRQQASAGLHSMDWGYGKLKKNSVKQHNECNKGVFWLSASFGRFLYKNNEESIEATNEIC